MKKTSIFLMLFVFTFSACVPSNGDTAVSYPNPSYPSYPNSSEDLNPANENFAPMPEDAGFTRGEVFIESAQLLTLESFPVQFMLSLKVSLPTPCHELRIAVSPPDAENKVNVEVYSIVNPDVVCVQVLAPFEVNYALGSFPVGTYSLWANGVKVADFQS